MTVLNSGSDDLDAFPDVQPLLPKARRDVVLRHAPPDRDDLPGRLGLGDRERPRRQQPVGGGRSGVVRHGAARRLRPPARRVLGVPAGLHTQELGQVCHGRMTGR